MKTSPARLVMPWTSRTFQISIRRHDEENRRVDLFALGRFPEASGSLF